MFFRKWYVGRYVNIKPEYAILLSAALLSPALQAAEYSPVRVVGIGGYFCDYWQPIVAIHMAVLHGQIPPEYVVSEPNLLESYRKGEQPYNETLNWVSGYFVAAQRFSESSPVMKFKATSQIVDRIEDICREEPNILFEEAAYRAVKEFLMKQ